MKQKTYACKHCGSEDVTHDAMAVWSVEEQDWHLLVLLDNADCQECGGETTLVEKPVNNTH